MLDREEIEKLGNLAGIAPFVRIPSPAFEELLRVYRAWLDAPVVEVQEIGDIDDTPTVIATGTRDELRKGTSLVYKQARLVPNSAIERGQDDAT